MKPEMEQIKKIVGSRENIVIEGQDVNLKPLADLYRLYEFSDRVILLEHFNYPGIDNYVKTGVMTQDEIYKVLEGTDE